MSELSSKRVSLNQSSRRNPHRSAKLELNATKVQLVGLSSLQKGESAFSSDERLDIDPI